MKTALTIKLIKRATLLLLFTVGLQPTTWAQGAAFTYQGRLNDGTNPANGTYDLTFTIFGGASGGSAVAGPSTNSALGVSNGLFTATLDFGSSPFSAGALRWLEIGVRTNGAVTFTPLSPRQMLTATPYAITAGNFTGTVGNSQLANNSITINAGAGLGGGGPVVLGGSATLSNTGVRSVTGNADITASTISGAVTLGDTATSTDTPNTMVKRDAGGSFSAASITLDNNLNLPAPTVTAGSIYSGGTVLISRDSNNNFFAGLGAGNLAMSGGFSTAVGFAALANNTSGNGNTAIGDNALLSNTSGSHNTAGGLDALVSNTQGTDNTAFGSYALQNSVLGFWNTAVGSEALAFNTNGANNVAVGFEALQNNRNGTDNTGVGTVALQHNTTGGGNTACGTGALADNTTGTYNTAVGLDALQNVTTGGENTALGTDALLNLVGGTGNIAIGVNAGNAITSGGNNIDIGNTGFGNESDTIRIGTTQTKAVMLGIYGTTIASGGTLVYVNPSGLLGTATSSQRFKKNIRSMGGASDALLALHPVTFQYKPEIDPTGNPQFGLVAEEVEQVDPNLVVRDDKHQIYSVRYEAVNAMLLNEFLKEHRKVEAQSAEIAALKEKAGQMDALAKRLSELERMMQSLDAKR